MLVGLRVGAMGFGVQPRGPDSPPSSPDPEAPTNSCQPGPEQRPVVPRWVLTCVTLSPRAPARPGTPHMGCSGTTPPSPSNDAQGPPYVMLRTTLHQVQRDSGAAAPRAPCPPAWDCPHVGWDCPHTPPSPAPLQPCVSQIRPRRLAQPIHLQGKQLPVTPRQGHRHGATPLGTGSRGHRL